MTGLNFFQKIPRIIKLAFNLVHVHTFPWFLTNILCSLFLVTQYSAMLILMSIISSHPIHKIHVYCWWSTSFFYEEQFLHFFLKIIWSEGLTSLNKNYWTNLRNSQENCYKKDHLYTVQANHWLQILKKGIQVQVSKSRLLNNSSRNKKVIP